MSAKWQPIIDSYLEQIGGIENDAANVRKEYCEDNGHSYNSFRRAITVYRKSLSEESDQTDQRGVSREPKPSGAASEGMTHGSLKESKSKVNPFNRGRSGSNIGKRRAASTKKKSEPVTKLKVFDEPVNDYDEDGFRSFKRGHKASIVHGGYANQFFADEDEYQKSHGTAGDIMAMAKARFLLMESIRAAKAKAISRDYEEGKAWLREVQLPSGETVKEPMTYLEALETVEFTGLDTYQKVLNSIMGGIEKLQKMEIADHTVQIHSVHSIAEITKSILEQREADELSALQTCNLFYKESVDPPPLLVKEAELEIANAKGEIDDTEGLSNDDIKALHEQAADKRQRDTAFLEQRRKENDQLFSELADYGSESVTEDEEDL